ncbi:MAG: hypothetical protein H6747_02915 [Deltaproteobacteria bacterium]|nr:hypothetical protein [Deltaproteobacteria bacterium]
MSRTTDVAIRRASLLDRLDAIAAERGSTEIREVAGALRASSSEEAFAAMSDAVRAAGLRLAGALPAEERQAALDLVRRSPPEDVAILLPDWTRQLIDRAGDETRTMPRPIAPHLLEQVARELEPPTEALETAASRLRRLDLELEADRVARSVLAAADTLRLLLNDLIDLASLGSGRFAPTETEFRVRDCVVAALDGLRPRAARAGVDLRLAVDDTIPDVVRGDPGRLRQVLHTLVGSAIAQAGVVWVRLQHEPTAGADPDSLMTLRFSVHGEGDVDTTPLRRDSGAWVWHGGARTGLGLAIARQLVERLGGKTWVGSGSGGESEIHFAVPMRRPSTRGDDAQALAAPDFGPTPDRALEVVFCAPGDESVDDVLDQLRRIGASVWPCTSVNAAGAAISQRDPDLLLICAALGSRRARSWVEDVARAALDRGCAAVGLLVRSGHRGDAAFCRQIGAAAYLVRPCSDRDLQDAMRALVDLRRQGRRRLSQSAEEPLVTRHFLRESRRELHVALRGADGSRALLQRLGHRVLGEEAVADADLIVVDACGQPDARTWLVDATSDLQPGRRPPVLAILEPEVAALGLPPHAQVDEILLAPVDGERLMKILPQLRSPRATGGEQAEPMALETIARHVGGDTLLARSLLVHAVDAMPPLLGTVANAIASGDLGAAERSARTLGACLYGLGLRATASAALEVARRCRAADRLGATEQLRELRPRALATLESMRATLGNEGAPAQRRGGLAFTH